MVNQIERRSRGGPVETALTAIKKMTLAILFLALLSGPLITFTSAFQLPPNLHTPQDGPRVDVAYSHGHGGAGRRGGHDRKMMKRIKGRGSEWAEKLRRGAQGEPFGLVRREADGEEIVADAKGKRDESADLAIFAEDLLGLAVNVSVGETTTTTVESTSPLDGFTSTTESVVQPTPVVESEPAGTTTETTSTSAPASTESSVVTPQEESVAASPSVASTTTNLEPGSTAIVPESSSVAVTPSTTVVESQAAPSEAPATTADASPSASVVTPVQDSASSASPSTTEGGGLPSVTLTTSQNVEASGSPVEPVQTTTAVQEQTTVAQEQPTAIVQDSTNADQQPTTIAQDQPASSDLPIATRKPSSDIGSSTLSQTSQTIATIPQTAVVATGSARDVTRSASVPTVTNEASASTQNTAIVGSIGEQSNVTLNESTKMPSITASASGSVVSIPLAGISNGSSQAPSTGINTDKMSATMTVTPSAAQTSSVAQTAMSLSIVGSQPSPVFPALSSTSASLSLSTTGTTRESLTASSASKLSSAIIASSSNATGTARTEVDRSSSLGSVTTTIQAEPSTAAIGTEVTPQPSEDVTPTTTADSVPQQNPSSVPVTTETVQSQTPEGPSTTQVVPVASDIQPTTTVADPSNPADIASGSVIQPTTTANNVENSPSSVGTSTSVSQTDAAQPTVTPPETIEATLDGQATTEDVSAPSSTEGLPSSSTVSEGFTIVPIASSDSSPVGPSSTGAITTTNAETATQPVETSVALGTSAETGDPTTVIPVDTAVTSGQTDIGTPSTAVSASFGPVTPTSDVASPTVSPSFGPVTTDVAASSTVPSNSDSVVPSSQATSQTDLSSMQPIPTTTEQASGTANPAIETTQAVSSSPSTNETEQTTELSARPSATGTFSDGNSTSSSSTLESEASASMTQSGTWSYGESSQIQSSTASASSSYEPYIPTATTLIFAAPTSTSVISSSTATASGAQTTGQSLTATPETTLVMPSTAVIASNVPTMIVPPSQPTTTTRAASETASSADNESQSTAGSALISILLNSNNYPWQFVVNNSDATSQLFVTFPEMLSNALAIDASQVQTYALQAYSPASYNGDSTELLTKWLGYIPAQRVNDLAQYIKTPSSPLYNQGGIPGQLALQIDSSYPLVGSTSSGGDDSATSATTQSKSDNTRRDTIIGVCVGVGGALWLALAVWIYRRVKRNHDAKIHRRLSERFSVGDTAGFAGGFSGNSRHSRTSSLAASEVDDRPSSFYANDADNFPAARRRRSSVSQAVRESVTFGSSRHAEGHSPRVPSGIGSSWFRSSGSQSGRRVSRDFGSHNPAASPQMSQNPFADIVHRSYLENGPAPRSGAWRHSTNGRPLDKKLIGAPTLQSNSLEFTGYQ